MSSLSDTQSIPARVNEIFARFAQDIAAKDGIPTPALHCRAAATEDLPDGSRATLWVADHPKYRCHHVDVAQDGGVHRTGVGACLLPGRRVSLGRTGAIVVGSVGACPAETVTVTTAHGQAALSVSAGCFLVPPRLTPGPEVRHTLTLIGLSGDILGRIVDLPAPGRADPS